MSDELVVALRGSTGAFTLDAAFRVARGPVALVGPNGAGKTTLLRALAGGLPAVHGHLAVRGQVWQDGASGRAPEQRRVGYLPQGYALFPHLSALDNVAFGVQAATRNERRARADALLAEVGAESLRDRRPRHLSGGEQQRVALARALATDPELLLLDEPTAALDVLAQREVCERLAAVMQERLCVVVTHDLRALHRWQPQIVALDAGRVCAQGSIDEVADKTPFLAALFG